MSQRFGKSNHAYKHGMANSGTFRSWAGMLTRCSNQKIPSFKDYGGRGIVVCERWRSFENFLADMGVRPEGTSLDRIDNDGNYEPGNCRWATRTEQNKNSRHNVYVDYDGRRMLITECADMLGIGRTTMIIRLKKGWTAPDLFRVPTFRKRNGIRPQG